LVLHDPADALLIADQLWVIQNGQLVQKGSPKSIIETPINHQIAGLFDYINVVPEDLDVPGPWHLEDRMKWLYAHDLPELDPKYLTDQMETPSGSLKVYEVDSHRLLKK